VEEQEYIYVKKKIRELTKVDLDKYGSNQMMRRLDGFMARTKALNAAQYFQLVEKDNKELTKLQDFLTINVSEFFRDSIHFRVLQEKIIPQLLSRSPKLNIWSAGCSNGAEPYSIAMILNKLAPNVNHRILATDIDKTILSRAAAGGPYRQAEIRNVAEALLPRYFTTKDENYWAVDDLRKKVMFKQQDLTLSSFESDFDLIICRNVVIYFNDETKRILRKKLVDALKTNGILFIGATETMLDATSIGFQRLTPCFYKKVVSSPIGSKDIVSAFLR
jgi:chemotaxis protein methyltransferase CheR